MQRSFTLTVTVLVMPKKLPKESGEVNFASAQKPSPAPLTGKAGAA
jgi:hypothetical protein